MTGTRACCASWITSGEFSAQMEGTTIASTWLSTSVTIAWLRYSPSHSTRSGGAAGELPRQRFQCFGLLAARTAPYPQTDVAAQTPEGVEQVGDAFGWDVRADVAEGERFPRPSLASREPCQVEPVVEEDELGVGDAELVAVAAPEAARGSDEEVDYVADAADVRHAPSYPLRPALGLVLVLVGCAGKVMGVAALGTLPVFLAVTDRPEVARTARERLHELPTRTHQPVVVKRIDHRDLASGCFSYEGRGEVGKVANVHHVRMKPVDELGKTLVHAGVAIAPTTVRNVDQVQSYARVVGIGLAAQGALRRERVLLAGKDMDFVTIGQRVTERLGVHLGAGVVATGVAVDDLENSHEGGERLVEEG